MMYIHYCRHCSRIHMLNGHKPSCPGCAQPLTELRISFLEFAELSPGERDRYLALCKDEQQLKELTASYHR